jgi:hypothetical protein
LDNYLEGMEKRLENMRGRRRRRTRTSNKEKCIKWKEQLMVKGRP